MNQALTRRPGGQSLAASVILSAAKNPAGTGIPPRFFAALRMTALRSE
jgi:hypothetical protein